MNADHSPICCPDCGAELHYTIKTGAIECGGDGEGTCAVMTASLADDGDDLAAAWAECVGDTLVDEILIDRCRTAWVDFVHVINGGAVG